MMVQASRFIPKEKAIYLDVSSSKWLLIRWDISLICALVRLLGTTELLVIKS
ncbi:hypothetical protein AM202_05142 [Actinobacillus minor 202]|uniref:Uncharacterized protein n=1 Tax=Actinobacillus minor 202 TaxID=591023 RepID=A0ABM9YST6_9PAST|nr:hypothetical protein AM202_05142 [Actinobacillus minor 202]